MIGSIRTLLEGASGLAHTRLELLGADLREERARLAVAVLLSLAVLLFAVLGVAFLAFAIMLAAWDSFRLGAALLLALAFLGAAGFGGYRLHYIARTQPRMFNGSLTALEKDRELLARSDAQREQLAQAAAQLAPKARVVEGAIQAAQWIGAALMLVSVVRRALRR